MKIIENQQWQFRECVSILLTILTPNFLLMLRPLENYPLADPHFEIYFAIQKAFSIYH